MRWRRPRQTRCGQLAPVEAEIGMVTCIRAIDHDGDHEDRHGDRWPQGNWMTDGITRGERKIEALREQFGMDEENADIEGYISELESEVRAAEIGLAAHRAKV